MNHPLSSFDTVCERLRAHLLQQRAGAAEHVGAVKTAADEYLLAVEADLAAAAAARLGVEQPHEPLAPSALLALQAAVGRVSSEAPPVGTAPTAAAEPPPVAPTPLPAAPAAVAVEPARVAPARNVALQHDRPFDVPQTVTDPALRDLFREFGELDLETPSNEVFHAMAEEFACRARYYQDQSTPDAMDVVGRIVRKLTALASQRNLRDVFGLKRAHQGDWNARATRAREEHERLLAPPPRAISTRIAIPETVRAAVAVEAAAEEGDDDEEESQQLPLLRQLAETQEIVLMGGIVKNDKLIRLRAQLGKKVEWVATDASGMKGVAVLEKRVLDGRVGAVVILEELISHKHYEPIVAAARRAHVPIAYGAKAGKAAIAKALGEIEASLASVKGATASG